MNRERIKHQGTQPLNGNNAYSILGIVFDWIEEAGTESTVRGSEELLHRLRTAGYCCCTTEFGCVACGGPTPAEDNE